MSFKNPGNIKVSVILPVYNVESYIVQCLDTLIHQSLHEIEIILIDDCSTDRSGAICDEFALKDERIVVIHNTVNIRQGLSRNKGIEIARGEYVGFVDPDDWVDLDFYEKLYLATNNGKYNIAKAERKSINAAGNVEQYSLRNRQIKKGLNKGMPVFQLFNYEHTVAIYKLSLLKEYNIRYPDIRNAEDNIFLLQTTYFAKNIVLISDTFYYYRLRPDSTVSLRPKEYFDSILQYFSLYLKFLNKQEISKDQYEDSFLICFGNVKLRFKEIVDSVGNDEYTNEYIKKALLTISDYKYDMSFILDNLFHEYSFIELLLEILKRIIRKICRPFNDLRNNVIYTFKKNHDDSL